MNYPREPFQPGTIKPEQDYEEFSRLGAKLGLPCPQAFIRLESVDSSGNVVEQYDDRSRTLNRNYWNWLFKSFGALFMGGNNSTNSNAFSSDATFGAGHLTNQTTAASVINTNATGLGAMGGVLAAIGQTGSGIVVGTGTTAESFEGIALVTPIAHGTSSGQLSYAAMTQQTPTYNGGTLTWTCTVIRIMNNNSGGTIVIGETAIYASGTGSSVGGSSFMIMRDKLGATVSVLNAGQLTVTYTFTLTFPA